MRKLILSLALVIASAACGASPRHVVVVVDNSLYVVLADTFTIEQTLLAANTPEWTLQRSQNFNKTLLPAVAAGRQLNDLLKNWKEGQPIPAQLRDAIQAIVSSLKIVTTDMPPGNARTKILENLATAQSVILTALNLTLTLTGN